MHETDSSRAFEKATTSQMRAWLRVNRPDLQIGRRGFLSSDAVETFRKAHIQQIQR